MIAPLAVGTAAQDVQRANNPALDRYEKKTYIEQNGTQTLTQTLEIQHHDTSDGEVEIQRYRAPAWEGDDRVSWEREIRTRKLPDGATEREEALKYPDGAGQLVPTHILREKTTPSGNATVVQRELLERRGGDDLQVVEKERVTAEGPDDAKQLSRDVQRLDSASGEWKTTERQTSSTSTTTVGNEKRSEMNSVKQRPDSSGRLADYERQQEHIVVSNGKETHVVTAERRDDSILDANHFFVERTTTEVDTNVPGNITRHVVRESEENPDSNRLEVIEEETTVERTAPDGTRQTVTKVNGRTPIQPSVVHPLFTVVETDRAGYATRIFIPAD